MRQVQRALALMVRAEAFFARYFFQSQPATAKSNHLRMTKSFDGRQA